MREDPVAASSRENPHSVLAEVMEHCRLSEKERRAYAQRMSRALLLEVLEVVRLYSPDGESKEER
ncbi:MAG: hypothetical protein WA990_15955 [Rubrobacteraceae bacterium]